MKTIFLLLIALSIFSCHKKCEPTQIQTCQERPPTDEACLAHFEKWFYNSSSNSCELIPYSGCNAYGFDTKEACEVCPCKKK